MRFSSILASFGLATFLAGASALAAPIAAFIPPGPGIDAPLAVNSDTVSYGFRSLDTGPWSYGGEASITGQVGAALRYESTLQTQTSGPQTSMSESQDWLLELDYRHTGALLNNGEWPFFAKVTSGGQDDRIVRLQYNGNGTTDNWAIYKGGGVGAWDPTPIVTGLSLGTGFNTFSFHYKSSSQTIDFYLNGNLTVADFTLASTNYAVDFIQLEWSRTGTDSYKNLTLSQVQEVPEPSMIGLLAATALPMLRRRK